MIAWLDGPRDRRTAVVGVVIVCLILAVGQGVPAVRRWNERTVAELVTVRHRRILLQGLQRDRIGIGRALARADSSLAALRATGIEAATPTAAGLDLSVRVERLLAELGLELQSATVTSDSTFTAEAAIVSVRLFLNGDPQGLAELLDRMESEFRGVRVRELVVTQPAPTSSDRQPDDLRIELILEATAIRFAPAKGGTP